VEPAVGRVRILVAKGAAGRVVRPVLPAGIKPHGFD